MESDMQISEPEASAAIEAECAPEEALSHEAAGRGDDVSSADEAPTDLDDLEEMEIEGRRHLIPRVLKGGFLMHADYTRKTQALAAERAALEAERASVRAGPPHAEVEALAAAQGAVEQFSAVDWEALAREDPERARAAWEQFQAAAAQQEALGLSLAARALAEEREALETLRRGHFELARDIPNWSPKLADDMSRFALAEFGFTPEEVAAVNDPRLVKLLHRAWNGAAASARLARMRPGPAPTPAYSLKGGSGGFHVSPDTDDFAAFERLADAKMKVRG